MLIPLLATLLCAVVLGGIAVALTLALRGSAAAARVLLGLAVVWLLVNKPVEIRILWTVAPGHGLVVADLLSPVLVGIAAFVLRHTAAEETQPRHAGRAGVDDLLFGVTLDLDDPALDPAGRPRGGHAASELGVVPWERADLDKDAAIGNGTQRRSRLRGRPEPGRGRGAA